MGKEQRIKISQDRTRICKYCIGDLVLVTFNKYGKHTFIGEVEEVAENMHDLEGFMWLIAMKILFFVLGVLFGVFVFLLALSLSALLSFFSFVPLLIYNKTHY